MDQIAKKTADKTCLVFHYLQVSFEWDAASESTDSNECILHIHLISSAILI